MLRDPKERRFLTKEAEKQHNKHEHSYLGYGVSRSEFLFGEKRIIFSDQYESTVRESGYQANAAEARKKK